MTEEIEIPKIIIMINNMKVDYYRKYDTPAKYIKIPLWLFQSLKQYMGELTTMKIDYETGNIRFMDLIICETVSIEKLEEIEVF